MKFSIVTPVLNGEEYVAETILSVITQKGNFDIEYIIVDGGSKDNTPTVIKMYKNLLNANNFPIQCHSVDIHYIREKDNSMYEAVNKGFSHATGDIYAYINSDDMYLPGAFQNIAKVFNRNKSIHWLKGMTSYIDNSSTITALSKCYLYDRKMIQQGAYGRYTYFIQQESVFWRRDLWEKCGPIDIRYRLAGDFYLWNVFARYTELYSLERYTSCFRIVKKQLSQNIKLYIEECNSLIPYSKVLYLKYAFYHHFQYHMPKCIARIVSRILLGSQKFYRVVLDKDKISIIPEYCFSACHTPVVQSPDDVYTLFTVKGIKKVLSITKKSISSVV